MEKVKGKFARTEKKISKQHKYICAEYGKKITQKITEFYIEYQMSNWIWWYYRDGDGW